MNDSRRETSATLAPPDISDTNQLADGLVASFMEVSRVVSRNVAATASSELTPPQFLVMRHLIEAPGESMGDLAGVGHMNPSAITGMVDRLEARGFVERVRDEEDRRVVHVRATKEGAAEYRKIRNAIRKQVKALLDALEPEELATLVVLISRLAELADSATAKAGA